MAWLEKEKSFSFEHQPIDGLFFLDGNMLARRIPGAFTKGYKYPTIVFPSGILCDLWESSEPENAIVHLFGEMDLSLKNTRDEAFAHAASIAEQVGYAVSKVGENQLDLWGDEGRLLVTYDNATGHMINVEQVRRKSGEAKGPPPPPLLDVESWQKLPKIRSQEGLGLAAHAVVKFFFLARAGRGMPAKPQPGLPTTPTHHFKKYHPTTPELQM